MGSLPLNQVWSPRNSGQMVRWTAQEGQQPKQTVPSPAKDCPSLQENCGEKEGPSPGCPHIGSFAAFSLFSPQGSWTHGKPKDFSNPKGVHVNALTGGKNINALPDPSVGQTGLGTKWKDVLENTEKFFCTYFTKDKFTRLSRMIVPFVDGAGNSSALKIFLIHVRMLSGMTSQYHEFVLLCIQTCMCSVASRLEPGSCDLNDYPGKPLPAAVGISPMGKSVRNASNLKTWFLPKNKQKNPLKTLNEWCSYWRFTKKRIFSLKKISLSFSPLQLGAEIVAPCIMQRKLF